LKQISKGDQTTIELTDPEHGYYLRAIYFCLGPGMVFCRATKCDVAN